MSGPGPFMKFYPADWRAEPSLRMVSLAARGLWIECVCLMHEATPYGHLLSHGRAVTDTQLALLVGAPVEVIRELLAELGGAGVYSRTRTGVIYSRRMTADARRAAEGRKFVTRRGGQWAENKGEKPRPNRSPNRSPITQKPDSSVPNGTAAEKPPDLEKPLEPNAEGWALAVELLRIGTTEGNARAFFGKLLSRNGLEARDLLPSILAARLAGTPDPRGYLTKAAQAVAKRRGTTPAEPALDESELWPAAMAMFREDGRWSSTWGPKPGEPGCRVPPNLLIGAVA